MTYLSRLLLNSRDPAVRRDLADCQELHRTILSAFPQMPATNTGARAQLGVLYRVEPSVPTGRVPSVLVQSQMQPDWDVLKAGYLLDTNREPENPACKAVDQSYALLREGATLRFRLRANPTKRLSVQSGPGGDRTEGRRVELVGDNARLEWLRRKAEQGGFRLRPVAPGSSVPDVRLLNEPKVSSRRRAATGHPEPQQPRVLTFGAALFEGVLQVIDADRFRDTLARGVGSGKAYGFGLLSIAPLRG